ncbi:MAG: tetratricopeptide repeat protein [Proteobacteria bacterium]|nr:tetratricopeptide repeat protein [Pseudomonadota bacterium]MBS0218956.1 tetratricopeptide repeat protein [Pseudomonadota bacterium]
MRPENDPPTAPVAIGERYRFDGVVVDVAAHTLERDGQPLAVEPKVFAALLVLLRHAGELVPHDELLDAVWGHRHITPGVLTRAIAQLRDVLGDDAHHPRYIHTQHAVGYRFIGELVPGAVDAAEGEPSLESQPPGEAASPTAMHQPAPATTPDHGHPHRGAAWRWLWSGAAVLVVLLVVAVWLDHRAAHTQVARHAEASIAVLPFTTLSDDQKDSYYAEGLSTEMHSALSEVPGIKVAAWLPPQAIDRRLDMRALGSKLGVAAVLDATIRRDGSRIRISARLSNTADGTTLWAHTYERDSKEIFDTQSEIANEVASTLVGVLPDGGGALRKRLTPTRNLAAYDSYLQGIYQLLSDGEDESAGATESFRKALTQDPQFARAQAGICRAEASNFINRHDGEAFDRAKAACERASTMDPSMSEVMLALGDLYDAKGEWGNAIGYFTQAASDPARRVAAYVGIAVVQSEQGHAQQATDYFNRALALNPRDGRIHAQIGYQQYLAGKLPQAIASFRKAVELLPDDADLWSSLGGLYLTAGQLADGERALQRSVAIRPTAGALSNLGEVEYLSGRYSAAVELLRRALRIDATDHVAWGNLGQALQAMGGNETEATNAFREAAERAQRYVDIKSDDAKALAELGWYRANLGQRDVARQLIAHSEALGGEPAEVAMNNAQSLARLGETDEARKRIVAARSAGIADYRISGNPVLRGILPGTGASERTGEQGKTE